MSSVNTFIVGKNIYLCVMFYSQLIKFIELKTTNKILVE